MPAETPRDVAPVDPAQPDVFDGCTRGCRKLGRHTRETGCEFAPPPPPPTPVLPTTFVAEDGQLSIRYEPITWAQAADMVREDAEATERRRTQLAAWEGRRYEASGERGAADQTAADLIAAVLAVTPVGVLDAYETSDRQPITERSRIAARQAVAVLRWVAEFDNPGAFIATDWLKALADAIEAAR